MKCPFTGQILQEIVETESEPYMCDVKRESVEPIAPLPRDQFVVCGGERRAGKAWKTEKMMNDLNLQDKGLFIKTRDGNTQKIEIKQVPCTYPNCKDNCLLEEQFCKDHTTLMFAQQAIFKIWEKSYGCYVKWPNVEAKQKAFLDFYTTRILTLENYDVNKPVKVNINPLQKKKE